MRGRCRDADRSRGTVLRATGGAIELRGLLDDCTERDLASILRRAGPVVHGRFT